MIIRIKNLHLHTVIGFKDWERLEKQEVIVNIEAEIPDETAVVSDNVADSVDYKELKYEILSRAEKTSFLLIERLAGFIMDIVMSYEKITSATVEVDKPGALRFADSVSVCLTRKKEVNNE